MLLDEGESLFPRLPLVSEGLVNMLGTASGFNLLAFFIPNSAANFDWTSKHSSLKCSLHSTEYAVHVHSARNLCTCLIHRARSFSSLGNLNKLTPSALVFEQPAATQRFTILDSDSIVLRFFTHTQLNARVVITLRFNR